jgi:ABC-type dipeptide/oligopeptide/nickel transport system ATPase component
LALNPRLLISGEPTTALDVTIQAQIIALLTEMQQETRMGVIFVTHDIGLVAGFAERVMVMQNGKVVEQGALDDVLDNPQHEYTRHLLEAVPLTITCTAQSSNGFASWGSKRQLQQLKRPAGRGAYRGPFLELSRWTARPGCRPPDTRGWCLKRPRCGLRPGSTWLG